MKKIFALALSFVMALSLVACGGSGGTNAGGTEGSGDSPYNKLNLKISVSTGEAGIDFMTAQKFADLVSEASGGVVQATVFGNGQLNGGDMSKVIETLLAGGTYEMCAPSGTVLSAKDEKFLTSQIPFIFKSYEEANQYLLSTGGEYYKKLANENGMTILGYFHNGLKQITNSKRECRLPSDFAGLKIRIPSGEVATKTYQAFGADPIAMSWGEVYTALQQGTVDGQDNSYMTIASGSIQEVNKYLTEANYQYEYYTLVVDSNEFNKWNEATQKLVTEKAQEACEWGRKYQEDAEAGIKQEFIDQGVIIAELTEAEYQAFVDATADIRTYFYEKYGEEACGAWGITG